MSGKLQVRMLHQLYNLATISNIQINFSDYLFYCNKNKKFASLREARFGHLPAIYIVLGTGKFKLKLSYI